MVFLGIGTYFVELRQTKQLSAETSLGAKEKLRRKLTAKRTRNFGTIAVGAKMFINKKKLTFCNQ